MPWMMSVYLALLPLMVCSMVGFAVVILVDNLRGQRGSGFTLIAAAWAAVMLTVMGTLNLAISWHDEVGPWDAAAFLRDLVIAGFVVGTAAQQWLQNQEQARSAE